MRSALSRHPMSIDALRVAVARSLARHHPPTPPAITQQGERIRLFEAEREAMDCAHDRAKPKGPDLCGASNRIDKRERLSTFVENILFRYVLVYPPTLRLHSDPHNVARAAQPSAITWQGAIWDVGLNFFASWLRDWCVS